MWSWWGAASNAMTSSGLLDVSDNYINHALTIPTIASIEILWTSISSSHSLVKNPWRGNICGMVVVMLSIVFFNIPSFLDRSGSNGQVGSPSILSYPVLSYSYGL